MSETRVMARERRHDEALGRQAAYDKLTTEQKLRHLDYGKFRAVKQRARLERQLEREKAAKAAKAKKAEKAEESL